MDILLTFSNNKNQAHWEKEKKADERTEKEKERNEFEL